MDVKEPALLTRMCTHTHTPICTHICAHTCAKPVPLVLSKWCYFISYEAWKVQWQRSWSQNPPREIQSILLHGGPVLRRWRYFLAGADMDIAISQLKAVQLLLRNS